MHHERFKKIILQINFTCEKKGSLRMYRERFRKKMVQQEVHL